nr:MAG TPA: hypothetical protein [Caudoviricetes sp.]
MRTARTETTAFLTNAWNRKRPLSAATENGPKCKNISTVLYHKGDE